MPEDSMDESSFLHSEERQSLSALPPRISTEDMELPNYSNDGSLSPLSALASTTHYNNDPGEQGEAAPAYTPIDRQERPHFGLHHQDGEHPFQSDKCVHRLWLWEILSIAVAALALVAIMITLILHRDRPLPKWPSAITINALIAVFTAVLKACLMMPIAEGIGQLKWLWYQKSRPLRHMEQWDLASRGPWGSILLIIVLKTQDLAVIGAILTIVAMAVDPFTQQVVQFYSCSKRVEGERATVPFSNNYTSGFWEPQLDPQMQLAIYMGLLKPPANTSAALRFECRTGNCTFPSTNDGAAFLSLALESRCTDIGSDIAFSSGVPADPTFDHETNATLPSYWLLLNSYSSTVMVSGSHGPTGWPSNSLGQVAYLMTIGLAGYRAQPQDTYAFECEFYPAVNTYSANITNGVLLEQVLDSQCMDVWTEDNVTQALFIVNRTIREGKWHECTGNLSPSDENNLPVSMGSSYRDGYGPEIVANVPPEALTDPVYNITWWPRDCVYWLPYGIAESLSEKISKLLGTGALSYDWKMERAQGNPWYVSLWNNGTPTLDTVQATMDGVTRAVTASLRQGDGISVNMGPANGTVWEMQTCVGVNWEWLALPAGLLLLTIMFLILTIVKTRSKQAQVWKSSVFSVLFSGLGEETRQADGPVASLDEMKAAADRATVRLEDTKEGFRLVGKA